MCARACQGNLESIKEASVLTSGGGSAGRSGVSPRASLPTVSEELVVPCLGLTARQLPRRQALCHRCDRSTSQAQAQRFQAGKRLLGKADPLVCTVSAGSQPPSLMMLSLHIAFSTNLRYMMFKCFL